MAICHDFAMVHLPKQEETQYCIWKALWKNATRAGYNWKGCRVNVRAQYDMQISFLPIAVILLICGSFMTKERTIYCVPENDGYFWVDIGAIFIVQ